MARILVVDDEEDIRDFLADALEVAGHVVEEAGDGRCVEDVGVQVVVRDEGEQLVRVQRHALQKRERKRGAGESFNQDR